MNYPQKEKYTLSDLQEIVRLLRQPGGCPWDREQTHESICRDMIEEAYEVVDAIQRKDTEGIREELGDVLLQVVFHACIEEENKGMVFDDITDGIVRKLIYRHPHVFGDVTAETSEAVLKNWEELKKAEKAQKTQTEAMNAVPSNFPALIRNEKVQKRAEPGWGAPSAEDCRKALSEQLASDAPVDEAYIGRLLANTVALARTAKIHPEEALTKETERFMRQFAEWEAKQSLSE